MREKAARGGKTVTTITGFKDIGFSQKENLMKQVQKPDGEEDLSTGAIKTTCPYSFI
jgi:translation initiation factor 1 (eIF-1/SUI1)